MKTTPAPVNIDAVLEPLISAKSFKRLLDSMPDRTFRRLLSSGRVPVPDIRLGLRMYWRSETVRAFLQGGKPS